MNDRRRIDPPHKATVTRVFPKGSTILATEGKNVSPEEYIAQTHESAGFRLVPIARLLGTSGQSVHSLLVKPIGSRIYRGELLVQQRSLIGLVKKQVTSPSDGVIESVQPNGDVLIRFEAKMAKVNAEVWGRVDEVVGETLTLATRLAKVYGVAGCGRARGGMLEVLSDPDMFLLPDHITPAMVGHIIVGGRISSEATLKKAIMVQVTGFVIGGMHARFWSKTHAFGDGEDSGITIMLTEGFGQLTVGQDIAAFIKKYDGRYAVLNAKEPALTIPIQPDEATIPTVHAKQVQDIGAPVRIIAGPYLGRQGVIHGPPGQYELKSGLSALCVEVDVDGTMVRIPVNNSELLW